MKKLLISTLISTCFGMFGGVCKGSELPPEASADREMHRIEALYQRALGGQKESIKEIIASLRHSDGFYTALICSKFVKLLVERGRATMEVLGEFAYTERKEVMWGCLASESATIPGNLLEIVGVYKNENIEIYQNIENTLQAGIEYMRLMDEGGEDAAVKYLRIYFDDYQQ